MMLTNVKKALFSVVLICSKVCSADFDPGKFDVSIRNSIASYCILTSISDDKKILDATIHLAKRRHIMSVCDISGAEEIPPCIPIMRNPGLLNFVRDFYLLFDSSERNEGAARRLGVLRNDGVNVLLNGGVSIDGVVRHLGIINNAFSYQLSCLRNSVALEPLLRASRCAIDLAAILKCIPTDVRLLRYMKEKLKAAERKCTKGDLQNACIDTIYNYVSTIKGDMTEKDLEDLMHDLNEQRERICGIIVEKVINILNDLENIKDDLDPTIRGLLSSDVVPGVRLAANLFVKNEMGNGAAGMVQISPDEMDSVFDSSRGKHQIVSTRKYSPPSYKSYMVACAPELNNVPPPACDVYMKTVVSIGLEPMYLSTFLAKRP